MKRSSITHLYLCGTVAGAALLVWLAAPLMPESSPVARGTESARMEGCINCHGQPGKHYPDDSEIKCGEPIARATHSVYKGECRDLLAYFEMVRLKRTFPTRAQTADPNSLLRGEILARQYNCFNCHGELGQGGFPNGGALKGYIPGYFGNDFALLTRGGRVESIQAWISHGIDSELIETPIKGRLAKFFIDRQKIGMPSFGTIPYREIQTLSNYVIALHEFGTMDAATIRTYCERTQRL